MMRAVDFFPVRQSTYKWSKEAAEAAGNPGQWFELTERETLDAAWSFATAIVDGRKRAFLPKGAYEGRTSGTTVYVRFIGGS
jgi:hypothetical protein